MPLQVIKRDIKRHRPIDWFAIVILISLAIVVGSIISDKTAKFSRDMDMEAARIQSGMIR